MAGLGRGGAGGADRENRERSEDAQITRAQLRVTWAEKRESLRQRYRRLTKKQPGQ